jgi:predicted ATPase/class 3 adenylate cyclase
VAAEPIESFDQVLERVIELLRREGRISYRRLKRQFGLDDGFVDDLKAELIDAKHVAADEGERVLVWTIPNAGLLDRHVAPKHSPVEKQSDSNYTPRHLTEEVFKEAGALEGEHKQVTVLFCDMVGSTELAQQIDAETMHEVMDRVAQLADIVHRFGGTINQYRGDGFMALFGAPRALEDHAIRAAHSAIAIHETLARDRGLRTLLPDVELKLRIGLNTGPVVVGRIGTDLRRDYTADGETTHIADRVQSAALPGTTFVTAATRRLIEAFIVLEDVGAASVKGVKAPVAMFRVVRPKSRRSRFEALAERGLTPLIDRQEQLATLRHCLDRTHSGRGNAVAIVGDAGIGKSRIVHAFLRSIPAGTVTVAIGQCGDEMRDRPYVPIFECARMLFKVEQDDEPQEIRRKIQDGTLELGAQLDEAGALFVDALAPSAGDAHTRHLDGTAWRKRLIDAMLAYAEVLTKRRPLVFVVEDLHWIDPSSEYCLNALVQGIRQLPMLLVTTHRAGRYAVPWSGTDHYTQIGVDVLSAEEATDLMTAISVDRSPPLEMTTLIYQKTGGNPLFVEEVMRSWLERQSADGAGPQGADAEPLEIPDTVDDILRARVDELDASVKRMLQVAAAIGPQFSSRLLAQVFDDDGPDVTRLLEAAAQLGFVQPHRFYPEPEYTFKHAIVQDVVYETLLRPRRRELHGQIGEAMEQLHADRLEDHLPAIAYHFSRSANVEKAFAYSLRAGEHAERLHARAEATEHYEAALTAARAITDSAESKRSQIDAMVKLAGVATTTEHTARDAKNLDAAKTWAEELDDTRRAAQIAYRRGRLAYDRGDFVEALTLAESSLEWAEALNDESLEAPPLNLIGRVHWNHGDYGKAAQLLVRSTEQMRRLGNRGEEATAAGFAGWTLAFLGESESAVDFAERGLRVARELRNPFAEAAAHMYRGSVFDQRGDWPAAVKEYNEAQQLAVRAGDAFRQYLIDGQRGRALAMCGDVAGGARALEGALAFAARRKTTFVLPWMQSYLAEIRLVQGAVAAARELGDAALRLAEAAGDKHGRMSALRVLSQALARQEQPDFNGAEEHIRRAIRIELEMGVKPELGRTYLEYAVLCQRMGQRDRAEAYLSVATDIFEQQEMQSDLDRAMGVRETTV